MSGVSGVNSNSTADLMKVLEQGQQASMDMTEKLMKLSVETKVAQADLTGLGQAIDLLA